MSMTIKELPNQRTAAINAQRQRSYARTWRVIVDSAAVGPGAARDAVPVAVGNTYSTGSETDAGAFCLAINAVDEGASDGKSYLVTATYGPPELAPSRTEADNPLDEPFELSWGGLSLEKVLDIDEDGYAIVNSAGEPFDPPVTVEDNLPILNIVRNESRASFDPTLIYRYRRARNSDAFWGADPGQVRIMPITAEYPWHPACGRYWRVTYQFVFNDEGWTRKLLDLGFRTLSGSGSSTVLKQVVDAKGVPVSTPVLLDGLGHKLAPGATPVAVEYAVYKSLPFAIFNLDLTQVPTS